MWDSEVGGTGCGELEPAHVAAFVRRHCAVEVERVLLDVQPLRGGLESRAVARVQAEATVCRGTPRSFTFVVKRLDGPGHRELAMYELLSTAGARAVPVLVGAQAVSPSISYMFLEWVPASRWPWAEPGLAAHVLEQLAEMHGALPVSGLAGLLSTWDYESELLTKAGATLSALEAAVKIEALAGLRRGIPALQRVVSALPGMRHQLLSPGPLGRAVLHGDVHSGNVLVRDGGSQRSAVLIDWSRARLGSPLEDVSSWLESLGYWEPAVRKQRIPLLRHYLRARGLPTALGRELYLSYWLAAACNALAGALHYHLLRAIGAGGSPSHRQVEARRAVLDHLHAIQLADAVWRHAVPPPPGRVLGLAVTEGD